MEYKCRNGVFSAIVGYSSDISNSDCTVIEATPYYGETSLSVLFNYRNTCKSGGPFPFLSLSVLAFLPLFLPLFAFTAASPPPPPPLSYISSSSVLSFSVSPSFSQLISFLFHTTSPASSFALSPFHSFSNSSFHSCYLRAWRDRDYRNRRCSCGGFLDRCRPRSYLRSSFHKGQGLPS